MQTFIQRLLFLGSALTWLTMPLYAQTLFEPFNNTTPATDTPQNTAPASPTNTPLSPSDFQKRVQSLEQATKHRVKQQLPKPAAPTTPASSSPVTDVPSAPPSQPAPAAAATEATTPTTTPVPSEPPTPAQPPAEQTATVPTPPAATSPKQNEIYTGFGTPDAGKANAPASGGASQSTGWGIQY